MILLILDPLILPPYQYMSLSRHHIKTSYQHSLATHHPLEHTILLSQVSMAFDNLDTDRSGVIDADEISAKYDQFTNTYIPSQY